MNAGNHVFVGQQATLVEIARSNVFDVAANALGADYSGMLVRDGWAPYDRFTQATHQQCVAQVLRRARELLKVARGEAAKFPRELTLATLRDCNGRFDDSFTAAYVSPHPTLIGGLSCLRKCLRRIPSFDEKFATSFAKGLSIRGIQEILENLYDWRPATPSPRTSRKSTAPRRSPKPNKRWRISLKLGTRTL